MLAPIIRTPSGFISALAFIRGRGFLARGQISTTRVKLEKFSSAVLWGGWAPSTQDLLLEKLSPTPTTVQVTQLPCTLRTLYLDFLDNFLFLNMCVPLSWSAARSNFLLSSSLSFSFSAITNCHLLLNSTTITYRNSHTLGSVLRSLRHIRT